MLGEAVPRRVQDATRPPCPGAAVVHPRKPIEGQIVHRPQVLLESSRRDSQCCTQRLELLVQPDAQVAVQRMASPILESRPWGCSQSVVAYVFRRRRQE